MSRLKKALLISLFLILGVDLLFFIIFYTYPTVFPEFLIKYLEPNLGPVIIGGFIIAITASTILLFLFYRELGTIMGKPLIVKEVQPRVSARPRVVEKIKKILKRFKRKKQTLTHSES